jgi:hypothetical protein
VVGRRGDIAEKWGSMHEMGRMITDGCGVVIGRYIGIKIPFAAE